MRKINSIFFISIFFLSTIGYCSEIIKTREIEGYFYHDGKMIKSDGEFEHTYKLEDDHIIRINIYNFKKNENIPDNTIYKILRQLYSDPLQGSNSNKDTVIRAIGQPGSDAVEIIAIYDNIVQSVKSTANYFVISRSIRIK
jgi:predicted transcriptional regulator